MRRMDASADPQQSPSSAHRKLVAALLLSLASHGAAITLMDGGTGPAVVSGPLQVRIVPALAAPQLADATEMPKAQVVEQPPPPPPLKAQPEKPKPEPKPKPKPKPAVPPTERIKQALPEPNVAPPAMPAQPVAIAAVTIQTPLLPLSVLREVEYLHNPAPAYPSRARRLGLEGEVLIRLQVLTDGSPDRLSIEQSSGYGLLDRAAMDAVRHWRFVPARQGDDTVVSWVEVPVRFSLER